MNEQRLRVGIVDDEFLARQTLVNYIARYCDNVEVLFQAANLPDAIKAIHQYSPDAIFLDIEMPGPSGMEIADKLPETQRPLIVFTTAYAEYAVDAFGLKAVDYLLKPIEVSRLRDAVSRLREQLALKPTDMPATLSIPTSAGSKKIPFSEILFLKADGSYTEVHLLNGTQVVVSRKLFELEDKLNDEAFLRTHRSYIVNMHHVTEYVGGSKSELILSSGQQIPVSRGRKDAVRTFLELS
jgi:two-component system LytT family response regulator